VSLVIFLLIIIIISIITSIVTTILVFTYGGDPKLIISILKDFNKLFLDITTSKS